MIFDIGEVVEIRREVAPDLVVRWTGMIIEYAQTGTGVLAGPAYAVLLDENTTMPGKRIWAEERELSRLRTHPD